MESRMSSNFEKSDEVEKLKSSLRVANAHYQSCCNHPINLQRLSEVVGKNGNLHQGRPTMLTCQLLLKRVIFFPNGTIQILGGGVTQHHLYYLRKKILELLKLSTCARQAVDLTPWKVNNVVYQFNFHRRFDFKHIPCDQNFSYEPELFPAALISKWTPVHVTLFKNGKGMITGVKNEIQALTFLQLLLLFLRSNDAGDNRQ